MPAHQLAAAIDAARLNDLDTVARGVWAALGAGQLTDDQAEALSARIERRRAKRPVGGQDRPAAIRQPSAPASPPAASAVAVSGRSSNRPRACTREGRSLFAAIRHQVAPDRTISRARRRLLAASGPLPPRLASHFSTSELAVLRLVAEEVAARAVCSLTYAELAARAGVCRTSVRNALRHARRLGLVTLEERRRPGRKNLPTLVRIVSAEWRAWLAHPLFREGRRLHPPGGRMLPTTDKVISYSRSEGRRSAPLRVSELPNRPTNRVQRP